MPYKTYLLLIAITLLVAPAARAEEPAFVLNAPVAASSAPVGIAGLNVTLRPVPGAAPAEEQFAKRGLSLRPWDGQSFRDGEWIARPGELVRLRLQASGAPDCGRAVLTIWDWLGNAVYTKPYGSFPVDDVVAFKPACHGIWLATLDAYGDSSSASLKSRLLKSFGAPVDSSGARKLWRKKSDYLVGSCFFPDRYYHWGASWKFTSPILTPAEGVDRLADLAARAGFTSLRLDSTDKNSEVLGILARHDIQAVYKVYPTVKIFTDKSLTVESAAMDAWNASLDRLIASDLMPGDHRVAWVEIGNEPAHAEFWNGTREQYELLYDQARKRIRAANPSMLVIEGGSCPPGADLDGLRRKDPDAYAAKKKEEDDWYAGLYRDTAADQSVWPYHQHELLGKPALDWREWERKSLADVGFKGKFLQTEGGVCAWRPDREVTTWAPMLEKMLYSWSQGEMGWIQFALAADTGSSRCEDGWSIIYAGDLTPKFQYGTIAAFTSALAGCTFDRTLSPLVLDDRGEDPTIALLFNHPGGKMVVWFGNQSRPQLTIRSNARSAILIDPMGNPSPAGVGTAATLRYAPYPQYLLLKGATDVH